MPARGMRSSRFVKVIGVTPLLVVVTLLQLLRHSHPWALDPSRLYSRLESLDGCSGQITFPAVSGFNCLTEPGGMRPILWAEIFHLCASYTAHLSLRFSATKTFFKSRYICHRTWKRALWSRNKFSDRGLATTADFYLLQESLRWQKAWCILLGQIISLFIASKPPFWRVALTTTSTEDQRPFLTLSTTMLDMTCLRGLYGKMIVCPSYCLEI